MIGEKSYLHRVFKGYSQLIKPKSAAELFLHRDYQPMVAQLLLYRKKKVTGAREMAQ